MTIPLPRENRLYDTHVCSQTPFVRNPFQVGMFENAFLPDKKVVSTKWSKGAHTRCFGALHCACMSTYICGCVCTTTSCTTFRCSATSTFAGIFQEKSFLGGGSIHKCNSRLVPWMFQGKFDETIPVREKKWHEFEFWVVPMVKPCLEFVFLLLFGIFDSVLNYFYFNAQIDLDITLFMSFESDFFLKVIFSKGNSNNNNQIFT